jgi:hypothetical protein
VRTVAFGGGFKHTPNYYYSVSFYVEPDLNGQKSGCSLAGKRQKPISSVFSQASGLSAEPGPPVVFGWAYPLLADARPASQRVVRRRVRKLEQL